MNRNQFPSWLLYATSFAIVGFGREGKSTYSFLRSHFPQTKIVILDENEAVKENEFDEYTDVIVGKEAFSSIPAVSVLFKTPGIPPDKITLPSKAYVTSQADLFVQIFGKQTIVVTGTKGKSTTSHLIASMLKELRYPVELIGNIGVPALDSVDTIAPTTTIVFEMSSFQCESLHVAPHIGVFTSLYQDHLDYYKTFDDYKKAKQHLFLLQKPEDICIYRADDPKIEELLSAAKSKKYRYSESPHSGSTVFLGEGWLVYKQTDSSEERIIHTQNIPLIGTHMILNCMPALIILREGLTSSGWKPVSTGDLERAIQSLTPLPGRLECVDTVSRIRFFDDALATIPEATIAALDTFGDDVTVLIVGGKDRGQDFGALAKRIAASKITTLILFPTTGKKVQEEVKKLTDAIRFIEVSSMSEAVNGAYEAVRKLRSSKANLPKLPIVLLSTASPSFGLFTDYADRSRQYKAAINELRRG